MFYVVLEAIAKIKHRSIFQHNFSLVKKASNFHSVRYPLLQWKYSDPFVLLIWWPFTYYYYYSHCTPHNRSSWLRIHFFCTLFARRLQHHGCNEDRAMGDVNTVKSLCFDTFCWGSNNNNIRMRALSEHLRCRPPMTCGHKFNPICKYFIAMLVDMRTRRCVNMWAMKKAKKVFRY